MTGPEPTEFDLGCFFHGYEGDITPEKIPYLTCHECGHLYWTEEQLVSEFNQTGNEAWKNFPHPNNPPWCDATCGDDIFFCAWCAHDF